MTTTTQATPAARLFAAAERPAWQERPRAATQGTKAGAITVILLVIAIPIYTIVVTSLSTQASINQAGGMVIWPHGLSFAAYSTILDRRAHV